LRNADLRAAVLKNPDFMRANQEGMKTGALFHEFEGDDVV